MEKEKIDLERDIASRIEEFRIRHNIGAASVVGPGHPLHNPERGDVNIITITDLNSHRQQDSL